MTLYPFEKMNLGSLELEQGLALGLTPRRLLVLLQGQVGIRWSTRVGISRTLQKRQESNVKIALLHFTFTIVSFNALSTSLSITVSLIH